MILPGRKQRILRRTFFFFKQKTAYEMPKGLEFRRVLFRSGAARRPRSRDARASGSPGDEPVDADQVGRASCRERVEIAVVAVSLKKKKTNKPKSQGAGHGNYQRIVKSGEHKKRR